MLFTAGFGAWNLIHAAGPATVVFVSLWMVLAGAATPLMTRFLQPEATTMRWCGVAGLAASVAAAVSAALLAEAGAWELYGVLVIMFLGMTIAPRYTAVGWDRDD
ncbi:hypothetical protein GCM10008096_29380 [Zhihengliuella salsuginis]|uniref:Uncharacterized protein n=2 Tax=Zhihengliuella salsuginis TaxID=578222 RepID=A0ABQ3GKY5_9MICC|nr:hypothetical protein GCM10008096_29380 [Zhihengliuella salsuginis]